MIGIILLLFLILKAYCYFIPIQASYFKDMLAVWKLDEPSRFVFLLPEENLSYWSTFSTNALSLHKPQQSWPQDNTWLHGSLHLGLSHISLHFLAQA